MPTVAFNLFDKFREGNFDGNAINVEAPGGNGIKIALVKSTYAPNQNLDAFWSDVVADEVAGTGYTAGGNVCANGIAVVDGAGLVSVDLDDPATWAQIAGGFTDAARIVAYHDTGSAVTSRLIGYSDGFTDQGNVNGDFFVAIGTAGLFTSAR